MQAAFLPDRGVIKVSGEDARKFLDNLVTADLGPVQPGIGRFAALLTPQGKIIADFLITEAPAGHGGGLLLDCPRQLAEPLATKLNFYKLRAKVSVEYLSGDIGVLAGWGGEPSTLPDLAFADPRSAELGWRILLPETVAERASALIGAQWTTASAYEAHRIACSVPRGGVDFAYGDAFPHETNMDRLHGVDFDKGCYIGQEVVSRMQHRGTTRSRVVPLLVDGPAPAAGVNIVAGDKLIGTMGSSADGHALALLRIDRAGEALEAGEAWLADGRPLRPAAPETLRSAVKKAPV
ncbi:MAG: YgfZ/GcvT domain-containing protein [Xanthobacteraceae bacterium]